MCLELLGIGVSVLAIMDMRFFLDGMLVAGNNLAASMAGRVKLPLFLGRPWFDFWPRDTCA